MSKSLVSKRLPMHNHENDREIFQVTQSIDPFTGLLSIGSRHQQCVTNLHCCFNAPCVRDLSGYIVPGAIMPEALCPGGHVQVQFSSV